MKYLLVPLMAICSSACAFEMGGKFEVVGIQTWTQDTQTHGVQFLADIDGAVRVGSDFRPTNDETSPLYKFKSLTYFLQNGERVSGYVANITIIDCHHKTSLQGPSWYAPTDEAEPMILPPKDFDFMPMDKANAFYPVAKRLCQWSKNT